MTQPRVRLSGISSVAWEHPSDKTALKALRQMPGFDIALRKIFGIIAERTLRALAMGSSVEVSADQYPDLNRIYEEVLETLDSPKRYPLFVSQNPLVNAGAVGMDEPFIVLNSGIISLLEEDQLRYVLGHEVGHILSNHVLYKTLLRLMVQLSRIAFASALSGFAYTAIVSALMEWDRKSELSSDRAGLLAVQQPDVVREALLRSAGGVAKGASIEAFQEQARRYQEDGDTLDSIAKALALLNRSHPFPVQRLKELDAWIDSGEYEKILGGEYETRSAEDEVPSSWTTWKESAGGYGGSLKSSTEPIVDWFRGIGDSARGWGRRAKGSTEE